MSNLDVTMAKLAHLDWKLKLTDFMYGVVDLHESDLKNHHECDFGKWMDTKGLKEFEHLSIMSTIDHEHQGVHEEIRRLVLMPKDRRDSEEGKKAIEAFKLKCDHLMGLMDELNSQI